jgi:hypothetical protein
VKRLQAPSAGKGIEASEIVHLIGERQMIRNGITGVFLIIATCVAALLFRAYRQHEVAEERTIRSAHGIATLERVPIGGIGRWIEARGENVNNPIVLWIHGGPGVAFIPLASAFQGPLEKHFNVVQWDKRRAGCRERPTHRTTRNFMGECPGECPGSLAGARTSGTDLRLCRSRSTRQCAAEPGTGSTWRRAC